MRFCVKIYSLIVPASMTTMDSEVRNLNRQRHIKRQLGVRIYEINFHGIVRGSAHYSRRTWKKPPNLIKLLEGSSLMDLQVANQPDPLYWWTEITLLWQLERKKRYINHKRD